MCSLVKRCKVAGDALKYSSVKYLTCSVVGHCKCFETAAPAASILHPTLTLLTLESQVGHVRTRPTRQSSTSIKEAGTDEM